MPIVPLRELIDDDAFDALLSVEVRRRATSYWSRVDVAQRAARWFSEVGARRVLDVGAGVGKFCIIASLATRQRVWGLERRGRLVEEGRQLSAKLGADVVLHHGTLKDVDPAGFDGLYFFNPFGEYVAEQHERFDEDAPSSVHEYVHDARTVELWLRKLPVGTTMITYNGLGGRIPLSWELQRKEELHGDPLRLWMKVKLDESDDAQLEVGDQVVTASALARLVTRHGSTVEDSSLVAQLIKPLGD